MTVGMYEMNELKELRKKKNTQNRIRGEFKFTYRRNLSFMKITLRVDDSAATTRTVK